MVRKAIDDLAQALTARRLFVQAASLAVCLWTAFLWNLSTPGMLDRSGQPKGGDFVHFYTLGTLARLGHGDLLYNMPAQAALIAHTVPSAGPLLYLPLYGPQVALFFAPWSRLPYPIALSAWALFNAILYGLSILCVLRVLDPSSNVVADAKNPVLLRSGAHRRLVWTLALAFPGFFALIAWGQTAGVGLALFTAAWLALQSHRKVLAGLALGTLVFKPQLALAAMLLFLLTGAWKVIAGASVSATLQLVAAWARFGTGVMQDYAAHVFRAGNILQLLEPRPYATHSVRAFWAMLVPISTLAWSLYLITAAAVLATAVITWRSDAPLGLRFSVLLTASVLIAPHLGIYDLVVLTPVFLWVANWIAENSVHPNANILRVTLYFVFLSPLLAPLTRYTHVQLSVLAILALHFALARTDRTTAFRTETS